MEEEIIPESSLTKEGGEPASEEESKIEIESSDQGLAEIRRTLHEMCASFPDPKKLSNDYQHCLTRGDGNQAIEIANLMNVFVELVIRLGSQIDSEIGKISRLGTHEYIHPGKENEGSAKVFFLQQLRERVKRVFAPLSTKSHSTIVEPATKTTLQQRGELYKIIDATSDAAQREYDEFNEMIKPRE